MLSGGGGGGGGSCPGAGSGGRVQTLAVIMAVLYGQEKNDATRVLMI